jgi:hypothetical protein
MATLIIDNAVIADAAAAMNMTEAQVKGWYAANYATIKAIRLYIQSRKTTEPEYIEQFAVEGETLDPTLVSQVLALLETGGLILRMET